MTNSSNHVNQSNFVFKEVLWPTNPAYPIALKIIADAQLSLTHSSETHDTLGERVLTCW